MQDASVNQHFVISRAENHDTHSNQNNSRLNPNNASNISHKKGIAVISNSPKHSHLKESRSVSKIPEMTHNKLHKT